MGSLLEAYVDEARAHELIDMAREFNIDAQIIGRVEASPKKKLTIRSADGQFEY